MLFTLKKTYHTFFIQNFIKKFKLLEPNLLYSISIGFRFFHDWDFSHHCFYVQLDRTFDIFLFPFIDLRKFYGKSQMRLTSFIRFFFSFLFVLPFVCNQFWPSICTYKNLASHFSFAVKDLYLIRLVSKNPFVFQRG